MIDLGEIRRTWLVPCGSCDYGLNEFGCTCPPGDIRSVVQTLVDELEKTRAELDRLRATNGCPSCVANACDEHIHLSSAHIGDLTRERHQAIDLLRTIWYGTVNAPARERWLRLIADANPATTAEPADEDELVPHVEHISAATIAGMAAMSHVRNPDLYVPWDDES